MGYLHAHRVGKLLQCNEEATERYGKRKDILGRVIWFQLPHNLIIVPKHPISSKLIVERIF